MKMQNRAKPQPHRAHADGRRRGLWRYNAGAMQIVRWSAEFYSKMIGPFSPKELAGFIAAEFPLADWTGSVIYRSLERLHGAHEVKRVGRASYEWNDAYWGQRLSHGEVSPGMTQAR